MLYLLSLILCWACIVGLALDMLAQAFPGPWAVEPTPAERRAVVARTSEVWSPAPVTVRPALPTGLRVLPVGALASVDVRPARASCRGPVDPTDAPAIPLRWRAA